ncbi:MAG: CDP-glycerol glycerophosphotransferase family protein [Pseudothermotoga sp.]
MSIQAELIFNLPWGVAKLGAFKALVNKVLRCTARLLFRLDKTLIVILVHNEGSGNNLVPILEALKNGKIQNCKVKVLEPQEQSARTLIQKLLSKWQTLKWVAKAKVLLSTHGCERKLRKRTVYIELWHGFPTKKAGLMDMRVQKYEGTPDIFCSYSEFGTVLRNACLGLSINRYVITGAPRNDYLLTSNGRRNLEELFDIDLEGKKVVIFAPTFRVGWQDFVEGNKSRDNLFGFQRFDLQLFIDFLKANNIVFFMKLHPNEEHFFVDHYKGFESKHIRVIDSLQLKQARIDFYQLLNGADLLITDYSSVYFDWLLLDRPVIFIPVDLKEYKETRGGWLLDYEYWTAGPKCVDQKTLQAEIKRCLEESNYYKEQRQFICNLVHKYKDANSTERVLQLIEKALGGER